MVNEMNIAINSSSITRRAIIAFISPWPMVNLPMIAQCPWIFKNRRTKRTNIFFLLLFWVFLLLFWKLLRRDSRALEAQVSRKCLQRVINLATLFTFGRYTIARLHVQKQPCQSFIRLSTTIARWYFSSIMFAFMEYELCLGSEKRLADIANKNRRYLCIFLRLSVSNLHKLVGIISWWQFFFRGGLRDLSLMFIIIVWIYDH